MLVAPLHEVSAEDLAPVLEEEKRHWHQYLFWDYRTASNLIRRYLNMHSLPGHVLKTVDGVAVGYSYYVSDNGIGYICNLFVEGRFASREAYHNLLEASVETLRASESVRRIESQIFPFNFDPKDLFERFGFRGIQRHYLLRSLSEGDLAPGPGGASSSVVPWQAAYLNKAAEVIYDSYRNSVDYALCHDYQSLRGCLRFLNNLLHSPGCGQFSDSASYLAVDGRGELLGVLLTSLIGPRTGMVPQVSVRRSAQSQGLGEAMLRSYFRKAAQLGLQRIALSVSEANQGASRLYRRLGFEDFRTFNAFIWDHE